MTRTTRKPHRKSHRGCETCKRRHVKCDEARPNCTTCVRLDLECSYHAPLRNNVGSSSASPLLPSLPGPSFSLTEMELLHHYSTCSCVGFTPDNVRHTCWTKDVPRLAFAHGFLLHQILAVAALHCYIQDPEGSRHLAETATSHRALALELVQPAMMQSDTGENETGVALFAFAGLTAIYAFGELAIHLEEKCDAQDTLTRLIACFRLTRGISALVQAHRNSINGSWAEAMIDLDADKALKRLRETGLRFDQAGILRGKIEEHLSGSEDKAAYLHAATRCLENIQLLLSQRQQGETANDEFYHLIMSWPNDVNVQFMDALESREPLALVIIAHFAVLMSMHRRQWWLTVWPDRVLADVEA